MSNTQTNITKWLLFWYIVGYGVNLFDLQTSEQKLKLTIVFEIIEFLLFTLNFGI